MNIFTKGVSAFLLLAFISIPVSLFALTSSHYWSTQEISSTTPAQKVLFFKKEQGIHQHGDNFSYVGFGTFDQHLTGTEGKLSLFINGQDIQFNSTMSYNMGKSFEIRTTGIATNFNTIKLTASLLVHSGNSSAFVQVLNEEIPLKTELGFRLMGEGQVTHKGSVLEIHTQ